VEISSDLRDKGGGGKERAMTVGPAPVKKKMAGVCCGGQGMTVMLPQGGVLVSLWQGDVTLTGFW